MKKNKKNGGTQTKYNKQNKGHKYITKWKKERKQ